MLCMYKHGPCLILEAPDPSLSHLVLEVCINSTKGNGLVGRSYGLHESVLSKPTMVRLVALDTHYTAIRKRFERLLRCQGINCIGCLLEVDVGEPTRVIDEDGGRLISLVGQPPFHLSNKPRCL